jgi:hypothetical protein
MPRDSTILGSVRVGRFRPTLFQLKRSTTRSSSPRSRIAPRQTFSSSAVLARAAHARKYHSEGISLPGTSVDRSAWRDLAVYKGRSTCRPSQALTTVGIFEDMALARSIEELRRLAGSRSVYSERRLLDWEASPHRPVKVINFLLAGHINPPITLSEMRSDGLIPGHPPQSIFRITQDRLTPILRRIHLGFQL